MAKNVTREEMNLALDGQKSQILTELEAKVRPFLEKLQAVIPSPTTSNSGDKPGEASSAGRGHLKGLLPSVTGAPAHMAQVCSDHECKPCRDHDRILTARVAQEMFVEMDLAASWAGVPEAALTASGAYKEWLAAGGKTALAREVVMKPL